LSKKQSKISILVDTNVLLHCKQLHEIDWLDYFSADEVAVVLCSTVLAELDDRKNDPKTSARARSADKMLSGYEESDDRIASGVNLRFVDLEDDYEGNRDARILRCAKELVEDGVERAVLVTDDGLMRRRARALDVETLAPDAAWMKPSIDEQQKEVNRLEREIAKYKHRAPRLKIGACPLDDSEQPAGGELNLEAIKISAIKTFDSMEKVREEHPRIGLDFAFSGRSRAERYNRDLEKFYQDMQEYIAFAEMYNQVVGRAVALDLTVSNIDGSSPATNVRGGVVLDDGVSCVVEARDFFRWSEGIIDTRTGVLVTLFGKGAIKPQPPERPNPNVFTDPLSLGPGLFAPNDSEIPFEAHHGLTISGQRVDLWARMVDHHDATTVGSVVAIYKHDIPSKPVQWATSVISNELSEPINGKLLLKP